MAVRVLLVAVSAAAGVWLGLGLSAVRHEERALDLLDRPGASARGADHVREARAELRKARDHNHDTGPLVREAQMLLFAREPAQAVPVLEAVVRREPENDGAWNLLAQATRRSDPQRSVQARRRSLALNP